MNKKLDLRSFRNKTATLLPSSEANKLVAKNAMIKPVFLYPNDNTEKIIKKLRKEKTNVCIVITKDKKFLGEISNEDFIKYFSGQINEETLTNKLNIGYRRKFMFKTAKDLINKHNSTVTKNTPINKVIKLIYKERGNYIPVTDKKEKVIGVVTPSSVLNLLKDN